MSTMVAELYQALIDAGVTKDVAQKAAESVFSIENAGNLATKADIEKLALATKADLADLKADLIKWNVGTLIAMTALFSTLVTLLKLFA